MYGFISKEDGMIQNEQIESLLVRYYNGELDEKEVQDIKAWIDASAANRKIASEVYHICFAADSYMMETKTGEALARTRKRIASGRFRRAVKAIERIAAALLLPVAGLSGWFISEYLDQRDSIIEVRSTAGMVSCVTLPDETKVWLNSDSYLRYPSRFGKERRVTLTGEGYFDVTKDSRHEFVVEAGPTEVVVHGTEFNVDSYEDEIRTTLVSGSVSIRYENGDHHHRYLTLKPSQQAIYDAETGTMRLVNENVLSNTSWKDGKIILDNTSLEDALRMIGNKYNVRFQIKNAALKGYNFTGTFSNQSLDRILHYFSISSDLHFKQVGCGESDRDGQPGRTVFEVS